VVPDQCQGDKGAQTDFLSIANAYSALALGDGRVGVALSVLELIALVRLGILRRRGQKPSGSGRWKSGAMEQ
jgi:hypothetical protein